MFNFVIDVQLKSLLIEFVAKKVMKQLVNLKFH